MSKSYHILVTFNICISQYFVCMSLQVSGDGTGVIYARANSSVEDWGDHFCISYDPLFQSLPQEVSQAVSRHPTESVLQKHRTTKQGSLIMRNIAPAIVMSGL